jgi:hypothetical protein
MEAHCMQAGVKLLKTNGDVLHESNPREGRIRNHAVDSEKQFLTTGLPSRYEDMEKIIDFASRTPLTGLT